MNSKPSLEKLRNDLAKLKNFDVVVYGSYCTSDFHKRSDIDVAVITRKTTPVTNRKIWSRLVGQAPDTYDIKLFELLPLEIKISIAKNNLVIFGDKLDISEYFYHFRKLWVDAAHRYYENQFTSFREKIKALAHI
ncbi:MAG: nucleotidyltransferase domain-containing protein [Candidatus Aenigmarchaeota archaeon]|nr:nucleotidyltransferase domain-containing protein [Candidatus Aenigmarchaeota archaeon]